MSTGTRRKPLFADRQSGIKELCPPSATPMWVGLGAISLFFMAYWLVWPNGWPELGQACLAVIIYALPCVIWDIWHAPKKTSSAQKESFGTILIRVMIKQIGVSGAVALCLLGYWLFPAYKNPMYLRYFEMLMAVGPLLAILSPFYLYWTDRRMTDPKDGCYRFGCLIIGQWKEFEAAPIREYLTGWLVKGFFWPLMFTFLLSHFAHYRHVPTGGEHWLVWYGWLLSGIYLVDVLAATAGYMMTLRAADSHIRSTDPTTLGWAVALICYPPFNDLLSQQYLSYDDGWNWQNMFYGYPIILAFLWGVMCLVIITIYTWATVCFGIRFSNLTYRGLVASGPYRWTKHPAYVTKNLFWWLTFVPFVSQTGRWQDITAACTSLALLNGLYFLRAKTEERHLMAYPEYQAYAKWVEQNGWIDRFIGWILRGLSRPFKRA